MLKIFFVLCLLSISARSFSAIIYVNANASGLNNGNTWANAYINLQSALSIAFINDEIWVAAGTYTPTVTADRSISFVMKNGVDIYGGFAGTESSIQERNIADHPTYLSGDIGALGENNDNSFKVVKIQNFTTSFIFDGFRVVSGYDSSSSGKGAGMYVFNNPGAAITINNTILYNNYAYHSGGGMIIDNSNTTFNHCEFLYNSSFNYGGGAIYSANVSNSNIYLYDCTFIGNNSRQGPVINFDGDELVMERNFISSNTSSTSGNIINVSQGVLHFEINNSLIVGNRVENGGSSVISSYTSDPNSSSLTNVTICHNRNSSNFDVYAEAVFQSNSAMIISNCIIYGNTPSDVNAQIDGGNTVRNSFVENGYANGVNISTNNPLFVNPGSLTMAPFDASEFDYSLQQGSPAINFGNNLYAQDFISDFLNNTRIEQLIVDCGAIESSYPDILAPIAECNNVTLNLNTSGEAILSLPQVNNNSTDNIGIIGFELSQTAFDCSNIGENEIQLIVSDHAGNSSECTALITVIDAQNPTLQTQNFSVLLDENGEAAVTVNDIDTGTTDNCGLDTLYLSRYAFTCIDAGPNTVVFTALDIHGNISSSNVIVNVIDNVFPTAIAQNLDVYLDANGELSLNPSDADDGSYDDCGIETLTMSQLNFSCDDLGSNSISFSVSDGFGNLASTPIVVTVLDTIAPVTLGQSITVNLSVSNPMIVTASQINVNSSDNCSFSQTIAPSVFTAVGVYDVVLTSTDPSGNSSSATYSVTVIDQPIISVEELTSGAFTIYPNPSNGVIFISVDVPDDAIEIRLYDITGQELSREKLNTSSEIVYPLNAPAGVYFIEISGLSFRSERMRIVKI